MSLWGNAPHKRSPEAHGPRFLRLLNELLEDATLLRGRRGPHSSCYLAKCRHFATGAGRLKPVRASNGTKAHRERKQ